ncbi:Aldolase/RraA-like protein 1 [Elsinoe fawcettii]|nr:Aldolase/RraA-like protein 1 [Elsinoe fawcettii]
MATDSEILEQLLLLDTNTVSDALDFLGLRGATYGLRPLWACPKIVGRVNTVQVGRKTESAPTKHLLTPVIDAVTTDDRVLVISGGIDGISCWGDILANAAKAKSIRGTIIDGMSRDIDGSRDIGYPVYGRGVTMVSARNRVVQYNSGVPIQVRGILVRPDDYVIADNCGTVFLPQAHVGKILELGKRIDHRQAGMIDAVRSGQAVSEVMHDTQFDSIQGPQEAARIGKDLTHQTSGSSMAANSKEYVDLFAGLDTAGVSDALDKLGITGQAYGIMPLSHYKTPIIGPAFTVRYVPADSPPGSVGDFIDEVAPGDVVVIDNQGRTDCTVWGDIMTQYASLRNIAGTVIDGVCRDVDRALTDDYPLFTRGRWMRTGKDRVQVGAVNQPIGVGQVLVHPRDVIVADSNGVVVVPRKRAAEVARLAHTIEHAEAKIREMIVAGCTIAEAREKAGYHTLQRKI